MMDFCLGVIWLVHMGKQFPLNCFTWVLDSVYHESFPWKLPQVNSTKDDNSPVVSMKKCNLLKMLMGLILLFRLLIFNFPHPTPVSPKPLEIDLQVLGGGSTTSSMLWYLCIIGEDEILHVIYMVPSIISMFELKILSLRLQTGHNVQLHFKNYKNEAFSSRRFHSIIQCSSCISLMLSTSISFTLEEVQKIRFWTIFQHAKPSVEIHYLLQLHVGY